MNNIKKAETPEYHELQIWTADMWAVLWGAWRLGFETKVHENFDFCWATSNIDKFNSSNIYHNAGVVNSENGLFYKGNYIQSLPYSLSLDIKSEKASKKYYELIQEVGKKSVLI
jgi:hypothetical protein